MVTVGYVRECQASKSQEGYSVLVNQNTMITTLNPQSLLNSPFIRSQ